MTTTKQQKGFALLSPEKRKEMARLGGKTAHALGVAHQWTIAESAEAGRKGGKSAQLTSTETPQW